MIGFSGDMKKSLLDDRAGAAVFDFFTHSPLRRFFSTRPNRLPMSTVRRVSTSASKHRFTLPQMD
jgi:hypothetical protein